MTRHRVAIYTANTGAYDRMRAQHAQALDVDWLYFTDGTDVAPDPWQTVHIEPHAETPMLEAKWWKLHPPVGYDHAIWIDANMQITSHHFAAEAIEALGCTDDCPTFAVYAHPRRDSIYEEIAACIGSELQEGKYDLSRLADQGLHYARDGFDGTPLYAGGVIVWTPEAWPVSKAWWEEIVEWTPQDQVSLPYVCWRENVHPAVFPHPQLPRPFNRKHGYFQNRWLRIWAHA